MVSSIKSAKDFFEYQLKPNLEEFRSASESQKLRKTFNVVLSLFHLADWVLIEGGTHYNLTATSQEALYKELEQNCTEFSLVRDIANCHKHCELTRGSPEIKSASSVEKGDTGFGELPFGEGPFGGNNHVFVTLDNGLKRDVATLIERVFRMWDELINQKNSL